MGDNSPTFDKSYQQGMSHTGSTQIVRLTEVWTHCKVWGMIPSSSEQLFPSYSALTCHLLVTLSLTGCRRNIEGNSNPKCLSYPSASFLSWFCPFHCRVCSSDSTLPFTGIGLSSSPEWTSVTLEVRLANVCVLFAAWLSGCFVGRVRQASTFLRGVGHQFVTCLAYLKWGPRPWKIVRSLWATAQKWTQGARLCPRAQWFGGRRGDDGSGRRLATRWFLGGGNLWKTWLFCFCLTSLSLLS